MPKRSPSGSLCPYYYKGGELHPLKYGSFKNDSWALLSIMKAEEEFILNSHGGRNVWIDLYDTNLSTFEIQRLAIHIYKISHKIAKLALVGCSKRTVRFVKDYLYKQNSQLVSKVQYFDDPEIAKDWLNGF